MISHPQLFRNGLEDATNLCNTILLPTVVQVYEFHKKLEKLKKKKALDHHKRESSKKGCVGKFTET